MTSLNKQYHVFFGTIDTELYHDVEGAYEYNGKLFWYRMLIDEDGVVIEDTCGRSMPIDMDQLSDLGLAVFAARSIKDAKAAATKLYDSKVKEISAVLEHFSNESN